jgi:hypothetical protein
MGLPSARRNTPVEEPRWPAALAALAGGGLYLALPPSLTMGPPWLVLAAVSVLLVPTIAARVTRRHVLNQALGSVLLGIVTLALVVSIGFLVTTLPSGDEPAPLLLRSAGALWGTNVLVFASWYWRLDAGGPNARDRRRGAGLSHRHADGAFLFPQLTAPPPGAGGMPPGSPAAGHEHWSPHFVDYLFLAFNTSTALSPTDTPVLTRWAKVLMMLQSAISFTCVVVLAARAINIL